MGNCKSAANNTIGQNDTIVKIQIINRTPNHYIKSDTVITIHDDLAEFSHQFKMMKEAFNTNIQSNFGFYELKVFYKNGDKDTIDVIYTVFDGLVIADENTARRYKNNDMDNLMLYYLRNK